MPRRKANDEQESTELSSAPDSGSTQESSETSYPIQLPTERVEQMATDHLGLGSFSDYIDSTEDRLLYWINEAKVKVHGKELRNIPLPYNLSLDTEEWIRAQVSEFAEQFLPIKAVEVLFKSFMDGLMLGKITANLHCFLDENNCLDDSNFFKNPEKALTSEMLVAIREYFNQINEIKKKKEAEARQPHIQIADKDIKDEVEEDDEEPDINVFQLRMTKTSIIIIFGIVILSLFSSWLLNLYSN